MEVLRQPLGSNICGHLCLSMVSGESIDSILKLIGHENAATHIELIQALRELGIKCGNRMVKFHENSILPQKAILNVIYPRKDVNHFHWVAYENGLIYDSSARRGGIYRLEELDNRYLVETRIFEYLEIH